MQKAYRRKRAVRAAGLCASVAPWVQDNIILKLHLNYCNLKEDGVKVIAELLRDNNTLTETNIITYINDNKDSL